MIEYNYEVNPQSLPFDLSDYDEELGLVQYAIFKCPGIYYLHMYPTEKYSVGLSLYVVMDDAPVSVEARAYGQKAPLHPELLFYPEEGENYSYKIVEYEIIKFYIRHDIPIDTSENLHSRSIHGMEICPDYFGALPAPFVTPWGYMTRYKTIIPGIFWIETDQCKTALAMSYLFCDDISDEVLNMAELTPFDQERGIKETQGYYFFQENIMCIVIFELMLFNCGISWEMIDKKALMNAIWETCPEYAISYNHREQEGLNDNFGMVLKMTVDPDYELQGSVEHMITITPGAGVTYLRFQKAE